jgi:F-type H+-transporting ATPase subunit gamma
MAGLEDLKRSIDTVEDLQSIVRTMKALSAASISQYERSLASLEEYNRTVEMGLHVLLRGRREKRNLEKAGPGSRLGAVVFGTDRGLCGRFNEEIAEYAVAKINGFQIRHEDRVLLSVGARVDAALQALNHPVEESFFVPGSVSGITETVQQILIAIDEWRMQSGIEHVLLFYHQHSSGITASEPRMFHMVPVDLARFRNIAEQPWPSHILPTYSMDPERLFSALIREYFFISIFSACTHSLLSEHLNRLASMQGAEKNIDQHMAELNGQFHHQRQQQITEELLDVISGFDVINTKELT